MHRGGVAPADFSVREISTLAHLLHRDWGGWKARWSTK
jgi:hypothetical protein